jgi:hypothetical protein
MIAMRLTVAFLSGSLALKNKAALVAKSSLILYHSFTLLIVLNPSADSYFAKLKGFFRL